MLIGTMKLWLGLGVVGMVAAIVVLFGTSLIDTPDAQATSVDFNRIIVEIEQPDKAFKVEKDNPLNTFTCQSTNEQVNAEFKDLKVSKDDDPNSAQQVEIWSGTFLTKCLVSDNAGGLGITISLAPNILTNDIVIKACHLQNIDPSDNTGPIKKAECIAKPTGTNMWKAFFVEKVNDGNLAGVSDILVGSLNTTLGLFYCIVKTDHEFNASGPDPITTYLQCNIDVANAGVDPNAEPITPPSWGDTCEALAARIPPECVIGVGSSNNQLNNPSETGADVLPGPPPPPPYTNLVPQVGRGFFYEIGENTPVCGAGNSCTFVTSCFQDVGPIAGTGPNIISTATLLNPKVDNSVMADTNGDTTKDQKVDRVSNGTVDIWYNQNNASCKALAPKGDPTIPGLPLQSIQVNDKGGTNINPNPAPWRKTAAQATSTIDFDGDGCTDEQELDPNIFEKCGDDPQNPSDSFGAGHDLSGVYDILVRVARSDCTDAQCTSEAPGIYFFCRADIQHNLSNNNLVLRPYCYADSLATQINPEAYPNIVGDGMAGGPPPGPQTFAGSGNFAYGDIDEAHDELLGFYDKNRNLIVVAGCFEDLDEQGSIGNVYVELSVSAHQRPGKVDIWINQTTSNCINGTPDTVEPLGPFHNAAITIWQANPKKGKGYDQDDDGVPTERELGDDDACGRRDPYNKNDYYDVSIPRDGVIDLPNDILGVILHFAPGGYDPGDENWDRPPTMAGAGVGSNWNRGSPDTVIDLPNDILGVILQFNPGGCPALS